MNKNAAQTYRTLAGQGSDHLTVLALASERVAAALYDAVRAIETHDIAAKTNHLNHAATLIGYMEGMLNHDSADDAKALQNFYNMARVQILKGSAQLSAAILSELASQFMEIQDAWKQLREKLQMTAPVASGSINSESLPAAPPAETEHRPAANWNA